MKAMILAAGFGTRLRPLTEKRPKPLMPVANHPLLLRNLDYLRRHGVREVVVNAHHRAEQVVEFVRTHPLPGLTVEVVVEPEILGTGGGIANTAGFWSDEPFFVLNGDVLTDIDLTRALEHHRRNGHLATLLLHDCPRYNKIKVDGSGSVLSIPRETDGDGWAFTGVHVLDRRIFSHIPKGVFSDIVDCYRSLIVAERAIGSLSFRGPHWRDIGSIPEYRLANRELSPTPFLLAEGCRVDPSAEMRDWAVIGEDSRVGRGAEISGSVLWENVTVQPGVKVRDSVLTAGRVVESDVIDSVF